VRAAICPEHGAPDVVRVEEVDDPVPGPGQVRVRVAAASVNFPDVLIVADKYQLHVEPPFVPGSELSGVVDQLGEGVTELAVGDRVLGTVLVGAFAELVVVDARSLTTVSVDLRTAAAFGVAHRTAWNVLRSVAKLQPGEELVVLGAGGGVGLAAVQLGAHLGATVTAVASTEAKLEAAEANGASRLVDHTAVDLRSALKEVGGTDVVVDPVGGALSEPALRSMRHGGRFVTVGYASGEIPRIPLNLVLLKGVTVLGFELITFATNHPDELRRNEADLLGLLADGTLVPHIGTSFPLDQAAAALRHVADGKAIGKVIVDV
jgi:NADPH2:quinone reductase